MFKIEVDEKLLHEATRLATVTDIDPIERGVHIRDFLEFPSPQDAIDLGVVLLEKDSSGNPRFHWHSDIRNDELEDFEIAILKPLVRAAIEYYLKKISEK